MRHTAYIIGCICAFLALCLVVVVGTVAVFFAVEGDAATGPGSPPSRITVLERKVRALQAELVQVEERQITEAQAEDGLRVRVEALEARCMAWAPSGMKGPTGPGSHAPHPASFYANRPSA